MNDNVNHPAHYTDGKIEVISFIEDKHLNFHRGNAVKYISRAGKKDPTKEIEDLEKADWYLRREIERLRREKGSQGQIGTKQDKAGQNDERKNPLRAQAMLELFRKRL